MNPLDESPPIRKRLAWLNGAKPRCYAFYFLVSLTSFPCSVVRLKPWIPSGSAHKQTHSLLSGAALILGKLF